MNICMLSSDFLPNVGGVAAHIYELSKALLKKRFNVTVINIVNSKTFLPSTSDENLDGIKVFRMADDFRIDFSLSKTVRGLLLIAPKITNYFIPDVLKAQTTKYIGRALNYIDDILMHESIDVIHSHTMEDAFISKFIHSHIPKIFTNHTHMYLEFVNTLTTREKFFWDRPMYSHINAVIAPSMELASKSKIIFKNNRIRYIPNGVDCLKFKPNILLREEKQKFNIPSDDLIVISPRRLVVKNGVEYFVKAIPQVLNEVNNVTFVIIGDGPEKENIKKLINSLNINKKTVLLGAIPNKDMPCWYNLADVVVIPSLIEATSIAGLEAMASGVPIVATNVGGLPEIITHGINGFLAQPKNITEIAGYLINLLKRKELRIKMGEAACRAALYSFSWDIIADKTIEVYKDWQK